MRLPFVYLVSAQLYAMLGSLIVFILIARWYLIPQLKQMSAFNALTALLWVHVPRYVTLILFSAQHEGYPISNTAAIEAVVGDVAGAFLALVAIAVLPRLPRVGYWLSWAVVAETITDIVVGIIRKAHEPLWGKASGVTWLILDVYIPFILVCIPLLVWQLLRDKRTFSGYGLSRPNGAKSDNKRLQNCN
jgi:hypothetical protein